jgi:hypothetical protein
MCIVMQDSAHVLVVCRDDVAEGDLITGSGGCDQNRILPPNRLRHRPHTINMRRHGLV